MRLQIIYSAFDLVEAVGCSGARDFHVEPHTATRTGNVDCLSEQS